MKLAQTLVIYGQRKSKATICSDLDNTIVDYDHYVKGQFGRPDAQIIQLLQEQKKKGRRIIIFTARKTDEHGALEKHLRKYKVPFDEITNVKPGKCAAFLDDRAVEWDGKNIGKAKKRIEQLVRKHERG